MFMSRCFVRVLILVVFFGNAPVILAASQSACTQNTGYPMPRDRGLLFYLQRTGNSNTVIYAVNYTQDGRINPSKPFKVYWRRFAKKGNKRALQFFERTFAFGISYQPLKKYPGKYLAHLVSYPKRKVVIEQPQSGKARAVMPIAGKKAQLECIYVEWRKQLGVIPDIVYVDIVGRTLHDNQKIVERIYRRTRIGRNASWSELNSGINSEQLSP